MSVLFSVFTPTNNPAYLEDCYNSLLEQTISDWEWVVVVNGPKSDEIIRLLNNIASEDSRVKVFPFKFTGSVGQLKSAACQYSKGHILVELDHDDMLVNTALKEIESASKDGSGFFYSDWTGIKGDGSYETFSDEYGWGSYDWDYKGRTMKAVQAFPPSARSICEVYWAPNHVRAFTREAYDQIGGYDSRLTVADDHDIVCRFYLAGVKFAYINKPLYIYRVHDTNTVKLYNAEIQHQQYKNRDQYLQNLIFEECRRNKTKALVLGEPQMYDVDLSHMTFSAVENKHFKLPMEDNTFGCVMAFDFLQLVPQDKVKKFIEEIHRTLTPGGWLLTTIPSVDGRGATQDLRHKSWWSENSWWYWTQREYMVNYYPPAELHKAPKFQPVRVFTDFPSDWHREHNISYVFADLCALKGQRHPGPKYV